MNLRYRLLLPIFASIFFLSIFYLTTETLSQKKIIASTLKNTASTFEKLISSEINADVQVMVTALNSYVKRKELIRAFLTKIES